MREFLTYPNNTEVIYIIESKFSQYYNNPKQEGGPLSGEYLRALYDDFAKSIRAHLPRAILTFDVSLPMSVDDFKTWYEFLYSIPETNFF